MLLRWNGPISATIYCRNLTKDLAMIAPFRHRGDFHLVLADFHPGRLYPVNTLRNVAIDNCRTNWMLLVDADFVPNMGLYEHLLPLLPAWERGENAGATAAERRAVATDGADLWRVCEQSTWWRRSSCREGRRRCRSTKRSCWRWATR